MKNITFETIKIYWHHVSRYPWSVVGTFLTVPLAVLTNSFLPPLIAADIMQRLANGHYNAHDIWGSFGWELLAFGVVGFFGAVIAWRLASLVVWRMEMRIIRDIHQRVFKHLMGMDTNFHSDHFSGALVSQTNKFAGSYVTVQDATVFEVAPVVLGILFSAIFLLPRAPWYVVSLLVFSALFITMSILTAKKVRRYNEKQAEASNDITAQLADAITNIAVVKSFAAAKIEETAHARATEAWRAAEAKVMKATQVQQSYAATVTTLLASMSLLIAVFSVVVLKADISTIFLVVTYTNTVGEGLWEFSQHAIRSYNRGFGDARAMTEILHESPAVKDPANPIAATITKGDIRFESVNFAHADTKDDVLFRGLSLHIPAGNKIGLVGHSGSGKTTLTRLLLRFSDIDGGAITIDGQNIAAMAQDDLRRHIAYVPQEPLLFHRSLRENIAYGKPDATEDEVTEAAHKAHAAEFIDKLPYGYDTEVGERGVKLSGGQRQRIAIARAILKDAPILILDEATSALDSESERLIQAALWELMQGRTAIVIAHRLSTIQKMDRIVVLEHGAIIEQGSHAELLGQKGVYAGLWAHQSGGFIEE